MKSAAQRPHNSHQKNPEWLFGQAKHDPVRRKVGLDTGNPTLSRDDVLAEGSGRGTGAYLGEWPPDVRVVCAFNTVWGQGLLPKGAGRIGASVSHSRRTTRKRCGSRAGLVVDEGSPTPSSSANSTARRPGVAALGAAKFEVTAYLGTIYRTYQRNADQLVE